MNQPAADGPPPPAAPLANERTRFVQVNGLQLCIREWGEAGRPAMVLLHGLRGFSATWRTLAQALSPTWRLVAIDQRGRGESDWDPEANYYTDAYLADLEAVVDGLGLERFVLVGHSMGGTTAYVYAARHPSRVAALVIEDIAPGSSAKGAGAERIMREMSSLPASFETWTDARAYWRSARPSLGEEALEQRLAESLREDGSGRITWRYDAAGISRVRLNPDPARTVDLWPVVEALQVPTLILRGGQSDFCPEATVGEMIRRNPQISSVTIPGASHYVHDDAPDPFLQHLRSFLDHLGAQNSSGAVAP
ncbi:alpha/beta fold hydrolase [Phenylobacterium montanum]|uniref:Alpha/beta hydrolase n=1 Tax=Phenylobacterium montanum TaxID=2823693 RepID=A0A975G4A1_9CAUL|nr:alpha/beta hydrolase [Caulobacter sp. S6]QUD90294.1 alpha/beta hydrolase [Caulobacter sp. S6]